MNEVRTAPEGADQGAADASPYKLRGRMGTIGLLFTVLAFTAPLGVVFGFISVNISFGIGVPIAFVGVAILVGLFALGFTAMTKAVPRPGAFYTYIREGLGRPMGLGGSFLALLTYGFNVTSLMVVAGIAVNNLLQAFSLVATPWWLWSLVLLIAFGALGYFNVELSARVLSVILAIEVTAVVIFDIVVIANGGPQGQSFEPWNPANLITPTLGVLLLFSIGVFNGFEATAIYRDEVRDPAKTIPRATYLAVIFLGVFYAISAYALIISVGASNAVAVATENPTAMMPDALLAYFGMFANQIIAILLVTSFFASGLSLQNILSRYTHSLAVDGIFPRFIAVPRDAHGERPASHRARGARDLRWRRELALRRRRSGCLLRDAAPAVPHGDRGDRVLPSQPEQRVGVAHPRGTRDRASRNRVRIDDGNVQHGTPRGGRLASAHRASADPVCGDRRRRDHGGRSSPHEAGDVRAHRSRGRVGRSHRRGEVEGRRVTRRPSTASPAGSRGGMSIASIQIRFLGRVVPSSDTDGFSGAIPESQIAPPATTAISGRPQG
jgi:hypothetical protein